jgi:serine/threonine-protein kinase
LAPESEPQSTSDSTSALIAADLGATPPGLELATVAEVAAPTADAPGHTAVTEAALATGSAPSGLAATVPAQNLPAAAAVATASAQPAAVNAAAPATRTASIEPRPTTPPPPPRIAVVALGDSAVTVPARQRIEAQLMQLGFDVVDSDLLDLQDGASLPQVMRSLRQRAAAVVVVRAEPIGSQQLEYYGQSSTLYSVNLGVRAYAVGEERPLGAGWREKVDFTTLNAEIKALEAVEPRLQGLVESLDEYRPRRRS